MNAPTTAVVPSTHVPSHSPAGVSPGGGLEPRPAVRAGLRRGLIVFFAVLVPLAAAKDLQLVWMPLLPIPLLLLTPRGATRALAALVAVLVAVGGAVTTYRAGMEVPDWPATFTENMWTYPLSDMLEKGYGVTLEHSHRLIASALGLAAICVLLTCFIHRARRSLTVFAGIVLALISFQGILGGGRVIQISQDLAFLHGTLAQAVVASIIALAVFASRTWQRTAATPSEYAGGAHFLGTAVAALLYVQIGLGAWVRHQGSTVALMVHGTMALVAVVAVLVFAKQLAVAAKEGEELGIDRQPLKRIQRWLLGSLAAQFVLGVLATIGIYVLSGGMYNEVSVGEAVFATAHVFVGATLFSTTIIGALYARRSLAPNG